MATEAGASEVAMRVGEVTLVGDLTIPRDAHGIVLFAHGSGSGRRSPRNAYVAGVLQEAGLATLLFDLLTAEEERVDAGTGHLRFDIELLAERLTGATDWVRAEAKTAGYPTGYFGASTGAAAALRAASQRGDIAAVVSRGGRPDLALECLPDVKAATLLIVGGADVPVLPLNQRAYEALRCARELVIVPGASHLFEEPGAMETVARLAGEWFRRHLAHEGA